MHGGNVDIKDGGKEEIKVDWQKSTFLCIEPSKALKHKSFEISGLTKARDGMPIGLQYFAELETESASFIEVEFPNNKCLDFYIFHSQSRLY